MKRVIALFCMTTVLTGCFGAKNEIDQAMALRAKLLSAQGCSFSVDVTADYGDKSYTFSADCTGDNHGAVDFTITSPEEIEDIKGRLTDTKGDLLFDDTALAFPLLADELLSPVSAPWIFLKTLRGGCITSAGQEGDYLMLSIDDSYNDDALNLNVWLDDSNKPARAEILHKGKRYLSMVITDFEIL